METHIFFIIAICGISILAFSQRDIIYKMQFNPYQILNKKEYYRLLTHGFIHADWMHLIINMFVLWSFGKPVIQLFEIYLNGNGNVLFAIFFLSAIPIASLYTLQKEKLNYHYNALGASGAVSAVVFSAIFFEPYSTIYLYFIPMPSIVFGVLYLVYSVYMGKRGNDNVGHHAHFWGAVYGFAFPLVIRPELYQLFIQKITNF